MRMSRMFGHTLREAPTEADTPSHALLLRGGYIDQLMAGVYSFMPLGHRVKRKIEQFGMVTITDNGIPSFDMMPTAKRPRKRRALPDYFARLQEEQPIPLTAEQARRLHEENRGER